MLFVYLGPSLKLSEWKDAPSFAWIMSYYWSLSSYKNALTTEAKHIWSHQLLQEWTVLYIL